MAGTHAALIDRVKRRLGAPLRTVQLGRRTSLQQASDPRIAAKARRMRTCSSWANSWMMCCGAPPASRFASFRFAFTISDSLCVRSSSDLQPCRPSSQLQIWQGLRDWPRPCLFQDVAVGDAAVATNRRKLQQPDESPSEQPSRQPEAGCYQGTMSDRATQSAAQCTPSSMRTCGLKVIPSHRTGCHFKMVRQLMPPVTIRRLRWLAFRQAID